MTPLASGMAAYAVLAANPTPKTNTACFKYADTCNFPLSPERTHLALSDPKVAAPTTSQSLVHKYPHRLANRHARLDWGNRLQLTAADSSPPGQLAQAGESGKRQSCGGRRAAAATRGIDPSGVRPNAGAKPLEFR